MELRHRPSNGFIYNATWQQLHVLTRHWRSDMEFYQNELDFLSKLINRYFIWLTHDKHVDQVQGTAARLLDLSEQRKQLNDRMATHLQHLENLQNTSDAESTAFRDEHASLEDDFTDFVKSIRQLKTQVFAITENIIEHEKLEHLLKR